MIILLGASMIQTIGFFPRYVVENMTFDKEYGVISITDPEQKDALISGTDNILRLRFLDLTEGVGIFNDKHAQQVIDFVQKMNEMGIEKMVVHCEAGVSRSAAVALSLYTLLDCTFNQLEQADFANTHVVATMQKFIDKTIVIPEKKLGGKIILF